MFLLRMAYLAPAIADFVLAALTLLRMDGVTDDSLLPRGQFAGVAFTWGVLLLLGLRRPVERAWILRPTALVVAGIAAAFLNANAAGMVSMGRTGFAVALAAAIILLCRAGWQQARAAH